MPRVLAVDPSQQRLELLRQRLSAAASVVTLSDFRLARERLLADRPELLVSNIRLGAFNGLHLAYLVSSARLPTRSILYGERADQPLAAEARTIGAFYETAARLPFALSSYVGALLPDRDRRAADGPERRRLFRGGRRSSDVAPDILRIGPALH